MGFKDVRAKSAGKMGGKAESSRLDCSKLQRVADVPRHSVDMIKSESHCKAVAQSVMAKRSRQEETNKKCLFCVSPAIIAFSCLCFSLAWGGGLWLCPPKSSTTSA